MREREKESRARGTVVNSVSKIDIISRFLFPFSFTLFNIGYWMSYFKVKDNFNWETNKGTVVIE